MTTNRRQFIHSACAAAGLGTFAGGASGATSKPRAAWTLALATYSFRSQNMDGLIERCRALNVRTIELSHLVDMLPQADFTKFPEIREKLKAGGVDLRSWYCGDVTTGAPVPRIVEGVHLLGVKMVSGSVPRDQLDALNEACEKGGFRFGIHNHYFENRKFQYETPDDILSALKGRPNLYSTLDAGHMIAVGVDPTEAYEKLKPHVRNIHLKDEDRPGHGVVLGKGKGDLAKFLRTITNDGFNGLGAIEYEEGTDPQQEVAECIQFIREQVTLKDPGFKREKS
jgi:sugar phosphate isomerase/epimerase